MHTVGVVGSHTPVFPLPPKSTGDAYREGCPSSLDRFAEKKPKSVRAVLTCVLCVCGRSADVDDALHFMRSV
jgi:hypothetical protein